ncbi:thiamine pyrophosphate-dependent enzyme [Chlamydiifrater phoenicopteri]|uniref:thiamine pyrophosphate-dependent enzyme n=1 Tax=Chlamydiifrater phoenicopteri TaxID=2681469 RepID=UPI001BCF8C1B|nr:thiamine pyrophosphate-dependent enzyme [Chlamydiifrater phoenicopteri]
MDKAYNLSDQPTLNISSIDSTEESVRGIVDSLGVASCLDMLKNMLRIREFETRGEAAYLEGLVGGFYHSYSGEEAIATAAIAIGGKGHYFFASYRCHAVALLLEVSIPSMAAELLGRSTGCALGRGGSMHMCGPNFPGGFGIVGGHVPLAMGGAFTSKYLGQNKASLCFIGDGAVAQGTVHETLNFASLHDLPLMLIIENNGWGMGTALKRAISLCPIGESLASPYKIKSLTINGFDLFNCLLGFKAAFDYVQNEQKPLVIESLCSRFRGHSISDPNLYRSKSDMQEILKKDPILHTKELFIKVGLLSEDDFEKMRKDCREEVIEAFQLAKEAPYPSPAQLEEGVYA